MDKVVQLKDSSGWLVAVTESGRMYYTYPDVSRLDKPNDWQEILSYPPNSDPGIIYDDDED